MYRIPHREQQQKNLLEIFFFLTEKGDLFINNSWVPIEHAQQKQCYSIENTVICHCFIWHLHFFFLPDTAKLSWMACNIYRDGKKKWSQSGDPFSLLRCVPSQLHTCVRGQARGAFSHIHQPPHRLLRHPTEDTERSFSKGLVEGWRESKDGRVSWEVGVKNRFLAGERRT